ncbi:hypothetical protein HJD18_12540 [Thermoleophilia bacterium SCSIO 60948]|nr:hypothetical protein HJD18_12540 [Thermoleophilia bacterium SCSIO 60948]
MAKDLCRGWSAEDIRELHGRASARQWSVVVEIARNPNTTTEKIADRLGWESHRNVRGALSALGRTTHAMGVTDRRGKPSWPFEIDESGAGFCRYLMPDEAAHLVDSIG